MKEEEKNRVVELTDEDIEKAAGGGQVTVRQVCADCGQTYEYTFEAGSAVPPCPYCGHVPSQGGFGTECC